VLKVSPDTVLRDWRLTNSWLIRKMSTLTLYRNDVPWVIRQWAGKIKHVHLKDVIGRVGAPGEDFMFPLLGEGLVQLSEFFAALERIGYKGFMSVEFESFRYYSRVLGNDPVKAARLCMSELEKLLARKGEEVRHDYREVRGSSAY
jgi:sugar phosphate isomerase/epimerase